MGAGVGAVFEGKASGEAEAAVGAGAGQDDAAGVVGDISAVGVCVVGEMQWADCGAELHDGCIGCSRERGDERGGDGEVSAEGAACGEHYPVEDGLGGEGEVAVGVEE